MKECRNPYCEAQQMQFADTTGQCPFCGGALSPVAGPQRPVIRTGNDLLQEEQAPAPAPPLETAGKFGRSVLRGRLVEMDKSTLFYSGFQRYLNSVLFAMPFQLGHQNLTTVLRIEAEDGVPGRAVDVHAYGEYTGRFVPGDLLQINCIGKSHRMATKIIDHTTNCVVRPNGLQIPAWLVRLLTVLLVVLLWFFVDGVVKFFTTGQLVGLFGTILGAFLALVWTILSAFGPCILILIGIWMIVTIPFRK